MMKSLSQKVCVCLINYNQAEKTIRCIRSILEQSFTEYQIVLVDNHSEDDSVNLLQEFFAKTDIPCHLTENRKHDHVCEARVIIIQAEKNGGFSYGNNIGIRYAQKTGNFTHILVLNNDTVLPVNFLETMLSCHNTISTAIKENDLALGAMETGMNGEKRHSGFHYLNLITGLVFPFPLFPSFRYLVGSCILLPANAPLMDEGYFLYYDDCAYSKILKRAGFRMAVCRETAFSHEKGATTGSRHNQYKTIYRSMKRFYKQYYSGLFPVVVTKRFLINILLGRFRMAMGLIRITREA